MVIIVVVTVTLEVQGVRLDDEFIKACLDHQAFKWRGKVQTKYHLDSHQPFHSA